MANKPGMPPRVASSLGRHRAINTENRCRAKLALVALKQPAAVKLSYVKARAAVGRHPSWQRAVAVAIASFIRRARHAGRALSCLLEGRRAYVLPVGVK